MAFCTIEILPREPRVFGGSGAFGLRHLGLDW